MEGLTVSIQGIIDLLVHFALNLAFNNTSVTRDRVYGQIGFDPVFSRHQTYFSTSGRQLKLYRDAESREVHVRPIVDVNFLWPFCFEKQSNLKQHRLFTNKI